jgi:hypothetical protein
MFKRHLISAVLLWILLVSACFWIFHTSSPNAQIAYQRLVNFSKQVEKEQIKEEARLTQQTRDHVSKQILYNKDMYRLQSRLASECSELFFDPKGKGVELVEHFKGLACAMQEELIGSKDENNQNSTFSDSLQPKQYMRYLKAREAIYSYKTGQLEAEDVKVAHYLLPGFDLPKTWETFHPLFQGQAQKLQLSLFKETNVRAQGFQATFHEWGDEW